ncbi:MAG TPA: error-prone DNA polymerase [Xanthobacteraceae bacterium]|nr:error-prone DNA polymerase [Xanthobacteraceae bacterium]
MSAYAELAVTTNFSFLCGASHGEELVERAKALGLAGLGIADRNSVAGVVRAHQAAKEKDLKFAPGARLVFADGTPDILAYPQDRAAWGRLTRLLTLGKCRAEKGQCLLTRDDLVAHIAGLNLIVLPGRLKTTGDKELAALLLHLREAAPRAVWLGTSMLYRGDDARRLARLAAVADEARVPLIAVGDVLYHAPERRPLQDVVTCIREHLALATAGRWLEANAERHLKPPHEMARLFRAAPETLARTLRFLERCRFSLNELQYEYPDETREGFATPQEALVAYANEGARQRYPGGIPTKVRTALDHELALIAELKYAPYFLTVHDIMRYARSQEILCQGRGSAANSVTCFCLGITEVDPERVDLLFERFVSAERREPPDIDVDFEHERREEVIQYIYDRYGRHRAGLAATVITYRTRSAIREVGKVFGLSDDTVGALTGMLWGSSGEAISEQQARRAGLDPTDPHLAKVLALTRELIGFPRHLSQHVGGFVITRGRLDEVVPIENAAMEKRTCVEWDKDDLDAINILKIDVLGLGMLSCLRRGFDLLNKHYAALPPPSSGEGRVGEVPDIELVETAPTLPSPASGGGIKSPAPFSLAAVPREEPEVYRMLSRADTIGVFQVESRAQMSMLPRLKPKEFYDLVIEVAIVRPGPIQGDMVHPYLRRRLGVEKVEYPSPSPPYPKDELEQVLGKTLGVPLFQEQAMRIAIVAAGFEPTEADKLRRAMATFRRVGTIKYFRDKFVEGMVSRGYPRDFAERCFRQIEGFGEYGFPESHAASFALLVYVSAWMKCRYPDVFAAALLNSQPMGFYAPAQIVRDARDHGVEVRPVDVNHSCWDNTLEAGILPPPPLAGEGRDGATPGTEFVEAAPTFPTSGQNNRIWHGASSPSPRLPSGRLRPSATGYGEGRGEGAFPPAQTRGEAPSPGAQERADLSPQAGRGEGCDQTRLPPASGGGIPRLNPRHAEMADDIRTTYAVRLGFRQISGFSEDDGLAIERCRGAGFDSIRDLWLRSALRPSVLERLAAADAFRSLGLDRRQALWAVRALRRAGDKDDLPLFARVTSPALEPDVALPPMRIGEQVVEDYRHLHLSLKAHPVAFLRREFDRRGILRHEQLAAMPSGRRVTVAGLVLVRQRPGSGNGVIFMTLEDETAVANTIVWPKIFEAFRPIVIGARLVSVTGKLQNESGVIHVVADRLDDLSPLLKRLADDTCCVEALAHGDHVKRSTPDCRTPPHSGTSPTRPPPYPPPQAGEGTSIYPPPLAGEGRVGAAFAEEFEPMEKVRAVMPKGRNFH